MIMYEASYKKGIVTMVDNKTNVLVPDCKLLCAGTAAEAKGVVIADEDRFWFVPILTPDVQTMLDKMIGVCDQIKALCEGLSPASTLLDNATQVVGQATMTPSVAKGQQISQKASTIGSDVDALKTEIKEFKDLII